MGVGPASAGIVGWASAGQAVLVGPASAGLVGQASAGQVADVNAPCGHEEKGLQQRKPFFRRVASDAIRSR